VAVAAALELVIERLLRAAKASRSSKTSRVQAKELTAQVKRAKYGPI
jgi:hypothetical protein